MKKIIFITAFFVPFFCYSQDKEEDWYREKNFLIIASFKQYENAYAIAKQAAKKLRLPMPNDGEYGSSPRCHYNDDAVFINIENSNLYRKFKKDLYIVVVASSLPGDKNIKTLLQRVKKQYPDAYIKTTPVYMGPLH